VAAEPFWPASEFSICDGLGAALWHQILIAREGLPTVDENRVGADSFNQFRKRERVCFP
jgi:hypothetical protein